MRAYRRRSGRSIWRRKSLPRWTRKPRLPPDCANQDPSSNMIRIWGRSTSLNVQKVLWLCVELGLKFERIDWAGPFGGNDDPAYLAKNPNGRVPTIEDGDKIVWESNSILRYLCAAYEGARLHPAEPYRRSEVERWMD